jgi:hypothetical protein
MVMASMSIVLSVGSSSAAGVSGGGEVDGAPTGWGVASVGARNHDTAWWPSMSGCT